MLESIYDSIIGPLLNTLSTEIVQITVIKPVNMYIQATSDKSRHTISMDAATLKKFREWQNLFKVMKCNYITGNIWLNTETTIQL